MVAPDFCGESCLSNCDAKAECGEYAKTPNATCPLNVWYVVPCHSSGLANTRTQYSCSQFGFCGTTSEFCDDTCQSNCIEHPDPPASTNDTVLSKGKRHFPICCIFHEKVVPNAEVTKVIGYYEGWNSRSECHQNLPSDLPRK